MVNNLFQWLLISAFSLMHPFFVSMTDIKYNEKDKDLEISVRIFTDDFENVLRKYTSTKVDILHPVDQEQMNQEVFNYLKGKLRIQVNDTPVQFRFIGYEEKSESIWTYLEVDNVPLPNKIKIVNTILQDLTPDQINLMQVKVMDKSQNTKLSYPDAVWEFNF
ncbi:MAG: DUF6702 family protein [Chitinophagaceae bacterium]